VVGVVSLLFFNFGMPSLFHEWVKRRNLVHQTDNFCRNLVMMMMMIMIVVASAVVNLQDCLHLFCEPEVLASDQTWSVLLLC